MKNIRFAAVLTLCLLLAVMLCACTRKNGGTTTTESTTSSNGTTTSSQTATLVKTVTESQTTTTEEQELPVASLSEMISDVKKQSGTYLVTVTDAEGTMKTYNVRIDGAGYLTIEGQNFMLRDSGSVCYLDDGTSKQFFSGSEFIEFRAAFERLISRRYGGENLDSISVITRDGDECTAELNGDNITGNMVFDVGGVRAALVSADLTYKNSAFLIQPVTDHVYRTDTDGYTDSSAYLPYMTALCGLLTDPSEIGGNICITDGDGVTTEAVLENGFAGYDENGEFILSFSLKINENADSADNISEIRVMIKGDTCHIGIGDIGIDTDFDLSIIGTVTALIVSSSSDISIEDLADIIGNTENADAGKLITEVKADENGLIITLNAALIFGDSTTMETIDVTVTEKDGALSFVIAPFEYDGKTIAFQFSFVPVQSIEIIEPEETPIYADLRDSDELLSGISKTLTLDAWHITGSLGLSVSMVKVSSVPYEVSFTFDENGKLLLYAKVSTVYDPLLLNDCYEEIADSYGYYLLNGSSVTEVYIKDGMVYMTKTVTAKTWSGNIFDRDIKYIPRTYKMKCTESEFGAALSQYLSFMLNISDTGVFDKMNTESRDIMFLSGPSYDAFFVYTPIDNNSGKLTLNMYRFGCFISERTGQQNPFAAMPQEMNITVKISCHDGYLDTAILKMNISEASIVLNASLKNIGEPFDPERIPQDIETDENYIHTVYN